MKRLAPHARRSEEAHVVEPFEQSQPIGHQVEEEFQPLPPQEECDFEVVAKEVGSARDLDGPAVMARAAHNRKNGAVAKAFRFHQEPGEIVGEQLPKAFQPVGKDAEREFGALAEPIDDVGIRSDPGQTDEVAFAGAAEGNPTHPALRD